MQLELDSQGDASLDLFPATYFFAARESTVRRRITLVVPRDPEASLTARLPDRGPSGSIRVLLLDSVASQPIRFCKVRAIGGKRPTFVDLGEQTSDLEGRVSFDDVPIGEVELRLEPGRTPGTDDDFDNPAVPYGPTTRRLVVERDRVTELEIRVPPVKWKDAPIQRIHLEARVIEAAGGAPIQDALVEVHVIRDDGYDFAGKVRTAADGTARAEILRSERYEVSISTRWGPAPPKYKWKDLELEPKDGVLTVEAALEPRPPEEK
jgi:hypothetical protein